MDVHLPFLGVLRSFRTRFSFPFLMSSISFPPVVRVCSVVLQADGLLALVQIQSLSLLDAWLYNTVRGDIQPRLPYGLEGIYLLLLSSRIVEREIILIPCICVVFSLSKPLDARHLSDPPSATVVSIRSNNGKAFPRDGQKA